MSSRAERIRQEIIGARSPLGGHSLSAKMVRNMIQGEGKLSGPYSGKVARNEARQTRFLTNFYHKQFIRNLDKVFNGRVTPEDITHLAKSISKFERPFSIPLDAEFNALPGVEITIVDFREQF